MESYPEDNLMHELSPRDQGMEADSKANKDTTRIIQVISSCGWIILDQWYNIHTLINIT